MFRSSSKNPHGRQLNFPRQQLPTSIFVWLTAIFCAILASAVILSGIVVFAIYLIYQPKIPYFEVTYAHLERLGYDQSGLLDVLMTLTIVADNDNTKASASFSDITFELRFHRQKIAELRAGPFDVSKNSTNELRYVVESSPIPIGTGGRDEMDTGLKQDKVLFDLTGQARTRWKIGVLLSVKFWTHLNCPLQFFPSNGTSTRGVGCSSRSH